MLSAPHPNNNICFVTSWILMQQYNCLFYSCYYIIDWFFNLTDTFSDDLIDRSQSLAKLNLTYCAFETTCILIAS